ncbi:MAG: type II secretion system protein GspN [Anaeromyxobacter sp.]
MPKHLDWRLLHWLGRKPRLLYGAFVAIAFIVSLRLTFPSEAVKERLVYEVGRQGWQLNWQAGQGGELGPAGMLGLHATSFELEDRTGLKIPIDEMTVTLRPLPLLIGRRVAGIDARAYGGRLKGTVALSGAERPVDLELTDLDLGQAVRLRQATGLQVKGVARGQVDVVLVADGKHTGQVNLDLAGVDVAGAQVPIPGMGSGLPLPRLALGNVTLAAKMENGKATAEKLQTRGGDAELTADGAYAVLSPRIDGVLLNGNVKLKLQDSFWTKPETSSFRGLVENSLPHGPDGTYAFQLSGTLTHPNLQPARNPQ